MWGKLQAQHDISGHDALAVAGEEKTGKKARKEGEGEEEDKE